MSRKVIAKISDGRKTYSEAIDIEEEKELWLKEGWGDFNEEEYIPLKAFPMSEISMLNGVHFIFGWWECFMQSDDVPMWIRETDADKLIMTVDPCEEE